MIAKIENKNPISSFLTIRGTRTPKEIWLDTETGMRAVRKKDIIIQNERLKRFGITADMTEEQGREQARKYREGLK